MAPRIGFQIGRDPDGPIATTPTGLPLPGREARHPLPEQASSRQPARDTMPDDIAARLAKAEACNVALEGLETQIEFGQLSLAEAVKQYQQHVAEIPFVHEQPAAAR